LTKISWPKSGTPSGPTGAKSSCSPSMPVISLSLASRLLADLLPQSSTTTHRSGSGSSLKPTVGPAASCSELGGGLVALGGVAVGTEAVGGFTAGTGIATADDDDGEGEPVHAAATSIKTSRGVAQRVIVLLADMLTRRYSDSTSVRCHRCVSCCAGPRRCGAPGTTA